MSFEDIATLRSIPTMTIYDAVGGFSNRNKKVIEVYAMNFEIPEYINIINSFERSYSVIKRNLSPRMRFRFRAGNVNIRRTGSTINIHHWNRP